MSALLGIFGDPGSGSSLIEPMLAAMARRGDDRKGRRRDGPAVLAVSRNAWEMQQGFSGDALVVTEDPLTVAADASLYYLDDLRRALTARGVSVRGPTASHHILAAYRAWGEKCVDHLEGDFSFVLWDGEGKIAFCARDFAGKRPLFYAELGSALVVSSTIEGVLAHPDCSAELDLSAIAGSAAGLFAASRETPYRDIRRVRAGHSLRWESGRIHETRHWEPPPVNESSSELSFHEAAARLRQLLADAVAERIDPAGPTSIWLSGGWDSPAVFAAGQAALRERGSSAFLRPVSISYPPGDPGREDELIDRIAGFWKCPVHWIDINDIPFLDRPEERAGARAEPFAHAFEMWNRALVRGSRATGARVALDGMGGDQLFQVSPAYLADLFRAGRWLALAHEWRAKGLRGSGRRNFFRWAVEPALPSGVKRLLVRARGGRPLRGYLDRSIPAWIEPDFVETHGLLERERLGIPERGAESCAAYETRFYLTHPFFPLISAQLTEFGIEEGVELRSPLYDRRVVEFALSRPRDERSSGSETKRLLRASVAGLLPAEVLAPRSTRTGTTSDYFDRSMRRTHSAFVIRTMERPLLAEFGIVDALSLREWCAAYIRRGGDELGIRLYFTLQAELWLRAYHKRNDGTKRHNGGAVSTVAG